MGINKFINNYSFLNNFYDAPVYYDGILYKNNEAAFQAQKSLDYDVKMHFSTLDPVEARNAGKSLLLRNDWESVKRNIMRDIVAAKFSQNIDLMIALKNTGNIPLEEGNHWGDTYWGTADGVGENHLGKILMEIRDGQSLLDDSDLILYHGSDHIIKNPFYGGGSKHNDYGSGFYCTIWEEFAREWSKKDLKSKGVVNKYHLNSQDLNVLDLRNHENYLLVWMTLLVENRNFSPATPIMKMNMNFLKNNFHVDLSGYDVIIGERADDSYFSWIKDFLDDRISLSSLNDAVKLADLGIQVVLVSEKAFDMLEFIAYEDISDEYYYNKRIKRETKATAYYQESIRVTGIKKNDLKLSDLRDFYESPTGNEEPCD